MRRSLQEAIRSGLPTLLHVFSAIAAAAQGYVLTQTAIANLVAALRSVHAGRRYIDPEAAARGVNHASSSPLTVREHEVLLLVAHGATNKRIATVLGVA